MKKILSFLLSCSILFITACSEEKGPLDPNDAVTITLWHYYHGVQQNALDELIKEFNTTEGLEKGIIIEATSYGGVDDLSNAVFASARGEAGSLPMPDIFNSYSDSAYRLAELNKLADLGDYFKSEELNEYVDYFIKEGYFYNDALNVFPVAKSTEIFMLNKTDWDIFEKAVNENPDYENVSLDMLLNWEGIIKVSEIYYNWTDAKTETLNDGAALFGLDTVANFFFVGAAQLGHNLIDSADGSVKLDEGVLRRLWDTYYESMVYGYFNALGRFRSDDVKTGDLLCFTGSSASAAYFPLRVSPADEESYDIEAWVNAYPYFESKEKAVIQQGAGMCISKSDERHEYAAAEFLKWFTESERNTNFVVNASGYLPVTKEGLNKLIEIESTTGENQTDEILNEVILICEEQIEDYKLYYTPAFDTSAVLRSAFSTLKEKALDARARVVENASDNDAYQAAIRDALNDEVFNNWINELKALY